MRLQTSSAVLALTAMLAACSDERTSEAETPVSEAEVSTELPESVVSDAALDATAEAAAEVAATPPPAVVAVPAPGQAATNATAPAAAGNEMGQ